MTPLTALDVHGLLASLVKLNMTTATFLAEEVAAAFWHLVEAARTLGASLPSPFMAMSFLALSVVPELKITDRGLVDTVKFELVPLEV